MKKTILLAFFITINLVYSQENLTDSISISTESVEKEEINNILLNPYNPLLPPNTYTNSDNPNYWKNKMPHEGYWQQP